MKFLTTSKLIRSARKKLRLSQNEFAMAIGVHLQVISNIERGIAGVPKIRAKDFARVMRVSVIKLAEVAAQDFYNDYLSKANQNRSV